MRALREVARSFGLVTLVICPLGLGTEAYVLDQPALLLGLVPWVVAMWLTQPGARHSVWRLQ